MLKKSGIIDVHKHPGRFDPEYCDDCSEPLYVNPLGEIVHAEMPEDASLEESYFH